MSEVLSFSDALCEVRKAHRLLWSFYDRLIPACQALMKEFEPASFYVSDHYSLGTRAMNSLNNELRYCTLPLLDIAILYSQNNSKIKNWHDNPTPGDYLLVLGLHLDSAFREYDFIDAPDGLGIESKDFPSPESSETRVYLSTVYCNRTVQPCNWFNSIYSEADWDYTFDVLQPFNLDESEATPKNADFLAYVKKFDIEKDFASPAAIKLAAENYREVVKKEIPDICWGKLQQPNL